MVARQLYIVSESPGVWGAELSLLKLLTWANKSGFRPVVVTGNDSPLIPELIKAEIDYLEFDFALSGRATNGSLSKLTAIEMIRLAFLVAISGIRLRKIISKADVVLAFSTWQSLETIVASYTLNRPCILDLHDTFAGRRAKPAIKLLSKLASGVIAPSESLLDSYGLRKSKKVMVVPRPIDLVSAPNAAAIGFEAQESYITVGIFGQIVPHKGILEFAQQILGSPTPIRLLVVGAAHETNRTIYEGMVASVLHEIGQGSKILPRVADVGSLMQRCDVVANVSHHEAFGRTIIEGMSYGAIPLVVDGGGPAEIVRETGVGCILQHIDETSDVLEAIRMELAASSGTDIRMEMWKASRRYSSDTVAQEYFGNLRSFLRPGKGTRER